MLSISIYVLFPHSVRLSLPTSLSNCHVSSFGLFNLIISDKLVYSFFSSEKIIFFYVKPHKDCLLNIFFNKQGVWYYREEEGLQRLLLRPQRRARGWKGGELFQLLILTIQINFAMSSMNVFLSTSVYLQTKHNENNDNIIINNLLSVLNESLISG